MLLMIAYIIARKLYSMTGDYLGNPMEFVAIQSKAAMQIQAYAPHSVKITDVVYQDNLIVLPDRIIENWPVASIAEFTWQSAQNLLDLRAQIILVGTGEKLVFPDATLLNRLRQQGISVEFMDTAAACRTFQILTSENRNVAAGLIL